MSPSKLDVRTHDGVMDVYLHEPPARVGARPFPTILFYFDAGGVRPTMHLMAARLAAMGYRVALPNLFHRAGAYTPFNLETVWTDPPERARIMALVKQASPAAVMADTSALLDALGATEVGCVGYCLGGRLAFTAAGALPERVVAAASIHGGFLATEEPASPHRDAARIRAKLYLGIARNDPSCSTASQSLLRAALDDAKVDYRFELYPAAHGFAVPDLGVYDATCAERHWQQLETFFERAL